MLVALVLTGCSKEELSGGKPPKVYINSDQQKYEATLGTYCWKATCVDTVGPVELLKKKKSVQVKPGENITIFMDYEPKPNEYTLTLLYEELEKEISLKEKGFTAPTQKGVYIYYYSVWWMDEKEEHVSNGDAYYAFALEVK